MTPKPILFIDFDGTISSQRYWRSLPPDVYNKVQKLLFSGEKILVNEWMRGEHTAEEINRLVAGEIGMPFGELWNLFVQDCRTFSILPSVLKAISSRRNSHSVILITDNMDSFTRFTVPSLGLEKYFDGVSNSFYERLRKADNGGELFRRHTQAYGASLGKSVLVDNSPVNCAVFEALGGIAHQVTPERDIMYYLEHFV